MRRWAVAFCVAVALVVPGVPVHSAPDPPGATRLIIHINATTTIALMLVQDAGKCSLVNSGSNYAAIDLGKGSATTGTGCATYSGNNTYTMTTSFSARATCSGTCANWNLIAALTSAAQSKITWTYGTKTLSTTPQTIASSIAYGTAQSEPFTVSVKTNGSGVTPTQVMTGITLTATDTTTGSATATATLNAEELNSPGISLFLVSDGSGVALTGGAFAAGLDFGTVSAYGTLSAGVSRPAVSASSYTVRTLFDVDVGNNGDAGSSSYTMQAALGSSAATGIAYDLDSIALSTTAQTVNSTGAYDSNVAYTLDLVISSSAPGTGGPAVGSLISNTINLTATAN